MPEIRRSQLLYPFGVGAIQVDPSGRSMITCGLDHWFTPLNANQFVEEKKQEHLARTIAAHAVASPRIEEILGNVSLRSPPEIAEEHQGQIEPQFKVPAAWFPCWGWFGTSGILEQIQPHGQFPRRFTQVRFAMACSQGHLCEFPWQRWTECDCKAPRRRLIDPGTGDLGSIRVKCDICGKSASMLNALSGADDSESSPMAQRGIKCDGSKPWLGIASSHCDEVPVGVLIGASNVHFPTILSALNLPVATSKRNSVHACVEVARDLLPQSLSKLKALRELENGDNDYAAQQLFDKPERYGFTRQPDRPDKIFLQDNALDRQQAVDFVKLALDPKARIPGVDVASDSKDMKLRREELSVLRSGVCTSPLETIARPVPAICQGFLEEVHAVRRLREVRAFADFSRLTPEKFDRDDPDNRLRMLFRNVPSKASDRWVPAIRFNGEGILLVVREEAIRDWHRRQAESIAERIDPNFCDRLFSEIRLAPAQGLNWQWASRYILLHSLSHMFIQSLSFSSGYSMSSIRERLFVSADEERPMASILLYTVADGAKGTTGGLVAAAEGESLATVVSKALIRGCWCSADPVCSEMRGQGWRKVNHAACQACVLLPETSCETFNCGLDRALVVGTPSDRGLGFADGMLRTLMGS